MTGQAVPWNDLHKQYIDGSVDGDLPMTRLSEMFNVNHFIVSQVNPHVVPFLPKEDGPTNGDGSGSSLVPRWVNTMTHLAKDEVLHRMSMLSELGVFPTSMTKFASIMNQKYSGDINIYPELISSNFPRILENPTTEFMLQACLSGERATWPRLSRIRNHCAIELALDRAIQHMRARVTFSPSQALHNPVRQATQSIGGSIRRRGIRSIRRSSHSHELERRRPGGLSPGQLTPELRKARSTVSLDDSPLISDDSISVSARPIANHRRSSISFGDAVFDLDSGSDNERECEQPSSGRPRPSRHRASWDSSYGAYITHGTRSPLQSGRSSLSGRSSRSASSRRGSPKLTKMHTPQEISMSLSPSSRHLSMTPAAYSSSPAFSIRRSCQ